MTQHEDYVGPEQAAALKQAGFDWPTQAYYSSDSAPEGQKWLEVGVHTANHNSRADSTSAPTLARAQKWLREVHNLYVLPHLESVNRPQYVCHMTHLHKLRKRLTDDARYFPTYEAALSAGITAALKMITPKTKKS